MTTTAHPRLSASKGTCFTPPTPRARVFSPTPTPMRAALVVLSLASLASGLFTAKAGGAAEVVDCSVCFANETLDVTELGPANDTEAEEAETKQERHSNQSTQIMVVGGLTGGFMVAAICRRPRRPRKAPSRWTQTPTQTPPPPQQQPRLRKLSTHWLAPHTYLPPSGRRKHHRVATVEQGIQTLPPPRSYEEGSQTFAVATRGPNPNPNPDPDPNPNPNPKPSPDPKPKPNPKPNPEPNPNPNPDPNPDPDQVAALLGAEVLGTLRRALRLVGVRVGLGVRARVSVGVRVRVRVRVRLRAKVRAAPCASRSSVSRMATWLG